MVDDNRSPISIAICHTCSLSFATCLHLCLYSLLRQLTIYPSLCFSLPLLPCMQQYTLLTGRHSGHPPFMLGLHAWTITDDHFFPYLVPTGFPAEISYTGVPNVRRTRHTFWCNSLDYAEVQIIGTVCQILWHAQASYSSMTIWWYGLLVSAVHNITQIKNYIKDVIRLLVNR